MAARLSGPAFVGRARELADLRHALSQPPAVVLIEGEAGMGKTRLVRELLASADAPRALVAGCPPVREPFTLGAVIDALRLAAADVARLELTSLAGALRPFFPEWAAELPAEPERLDDATATRHRLFRALAELIGALDIELLVVEDAHWADDTTLEFLLFLRSRQRPVLSMLVTYRPEDVPAGSLLLRLAGRAAPGATRSRLSLTGLDVEQTGQLVSSMLQGEQVSGEFAGFLHERTEGLPLAVEEVVRLMHDRADLTQRSGTWVRRHLDAVVVPPTVRDAVLERVTRLSEDAQVVLRAAAVLSSPAGEQTLAAIGDLTVERACAGVDEAVDAGLLQVVDHRQLSFRHVLASRAVDESLPRALRRTLHRRAGELLEQHSQPPPVRLARHFREAGDLVRWRKYAELAADVALTTGASLEAIRLLSDLVVARPPARDLVRLMYKMPFTDPHRYPQLIGALREALDDDLDRGTRAAVRFQLGYALTKIQEYGAGRTELERAVPDLGHDPQRAARAMVLLGWPLDGDQSAAVHLEWLRRAEEVLPPLGSPERTGLDQDRASALLMLGDPAGWIVAESLPDHGDNHQVDPVMAAAQPVGAFVAGHINLSHLETVWGRYADARRRIHTVAELVRTNELGHLSGMLAVNAAHLDLFCGEWNGLAERTEAIARNDDLLPMTRLEARLIRERLRYALEPPSPADDPLIEVIEGSLRHGVVAETMEPAAALAQLRLATGRAVDALAVTDRPMTIVERTQIWLWATELAPVRVDALVAAGRLDEAAALVEAFEIGLGELDALAPGAALLQSRASVAVARGERDAAAAFEAAAIAWERLPRPYEALLARERQARCLIRAGHTRSALQLLTAVLDGLSMLGARPAAARAAETLRSHGVEVTTPWRGGRRGYGDQLSPRELDVVRLVSRGQTNREIAEALFLSPKTVARHLNSAMRKLGVPSRTALAVQAIESGLIAGQ